jgi:hypothetical protein
MILEGLIEGPLAPDRVVMPPVPDEKDTLAAKTAALPQRSQPRLMATPGEHFAIQKSLVQLARSSHRLSCRAERGEIHEWSAHQLDGRRASARRLAL